ncbi:hypothetical protein SO802_013324 [Lithocarpus litseifolius]|uniref:AAA+ ATPase domain-containing protein n=1 Tax=Lithocarpus litseifolius TaxID=425828 RepID=A0AAW2D5A6_9ROSI
MGQQVARERGCVACGVGGNGSALAREREAVWAEWLAVWLAVWVVMALARERGCVACCVACGVAVWVLTGERVETEQREVRKGRCGQSLWKLRPVIRSEEEHTRWDWPSRNSRIRRTLSIRLVVVSLYEEVPQFLLKGYEDFESRKSTFNGIMKVLKADNIHAIGVYGMGGVGKTMLVGKVATQAIEDKLFERVITVVASQTPDLKKIQKDIAKELGLSFLDEDTDFQKAHLLRERLKKEKILVIIDDIWSKLDLEVLGISFEGDHKGSKLLLTSRSRDVLVTDMDVQEKFEIGVLSDKEAIALFSKIVGDLAENLNLQSTMVEVVKECARLPIAITTVANALKNRNNLPVWKNALQQLKRANPTEIKGMHEKVYPSIKLSYDFLTKEAQSLFLFCSLFDEDEEIPIAFLWRFLVGLDFFQDVYTMEDVRNRVYTLVESLKASCLLLDGEISDKKNKLLMVRSSIDLGKGSNMKILKESIGIALFETNFGELPIRLEHPKLKFIFMANRSNYWPVPNPFFEGAKELRVLVLVRICAPLPSSLSCLHNLQTLLLSDCLLEDVAIIGELKNLKALMIYYSNIKQLPIEIGQLTCLQLLDFKDCTKLEVIPTNVISNMKMLEELYMNNSFNQWQVDGESNQSIVRSNARVSELDHMSRLTTLCIHIPNAKILPKALLFERLVRYEILIGANWDWDDDSFINEFEFSRKLKLDLDRSFQLDDGVKILLKNCEYLDLAPGKDYKNILYEVDKDGFPQLKHLYVRNSDKIQYIINSIGVQCVAFPVLELIYLLNAINLEKICHDKLAMGSFQNLRKLEVEHCDKLIFVFSSANLRCFSQLQEIYIQTCNLMSAIVGVERIHDIEVNNDLTTDIMDFTQLRSLNLQRLPNLMGFRSDVESQLLFNEKVAFSNLEKLFIIGINNLKTLWHNQLVPDSFCKLNQLHVNNCENLMNIFPPNMLRRLQNLESLLISDCNSVEEVFEVRGANVNEICGMVPTQLRVLTLINLPKLKHVWTSDLLSTLTFQALREVQVSNCKGLKSLFPASVAKSLEQLERLQISDSGLEEIIAVEEGSETVQFMFPRIFSLSLELLPELKCFYPRKHNSEWPSLKFLEIYKCDKVKIIALNELNSPETKELDYHLSIQQPLFLIEKDTLSNLENLKLDWDDTMNETYGRLLAQFFCKLKVLKLYCKNDRSTAFPLAFVQRLYNLKELHIIDFFLEEISPCGLVNNEGQYAGTFECLTELKLSKMPKLMHLWKENSQQGRELQNLEILRVYECGRLKNLVSSSMYFQNLNTLEVTKCHGLISLATSSAAKSLVQLKRLRIYDCKRMREIVTNEGEGEAEDEICFNQLIFLMLQGLPTLRSFHLGNCSIKFPSLEYLTVTECPEMKIFSNGVLNMPKLKQVGFGENNEWEDQREVSVEEDVNSTIKRYWEESYDPCVRQLFTEKTNASTSEAGE